MRVRIWLVGYSLSSAYILVNDQRSINNTPGEDIGHIVW